jgi:glycogen debranching enzyme
VKKIAFLVIDPDTLTHEERAAWSFLSQLRGYRARRVRFSSIERNPRLLDNYDLAWWHFDSSTALPDISLTADVVETMKSFVSKGCGLLLSLLSSQYVVELGLEPVRPNICVSGAWNEQSWAEGYPDIRGFASYGPHPIFNGFSGGLYTWAPGTGNHFSASYYDDQLPQSGAVVSVEKAYISLNEQRRLIIEYRLGRGQILTVGAHLYFADAKQRFRRQLELFASNCLSYLCAQHPQQATGGPLASHRRRTHWTFDTPRVTEFKHTCKAVVLENRTLPKTPDGLALHRDLSSPDLIEQFFDLSGRRILLMGGERGGITEVWCHPVKTLENLKVRFKVGASPSRWSHELTPVITIQPESLRRRYTLNNAIVEETIFADLTHPCGAIHYQVKSDESVQIFLTARMDLRHMWPLSERATGSLRFAWDKGLRAGIATDSNGDTSSVLGSSLRPTEWLIGQYSEVVLENDQLLGRLTGDSVVAIGLCVSLNRKSSQSTFAFAGSGQSLQESVRAYRSIIRKPGSSLRRQSARFRSLLSSSTQIVTPDEQLNNAFRWSLAGLEKLFVETPPLGRSFMAGYGLSSSGWNGGHSVSGRPGYAWYFGRDSVWTSLAALAAGEHEKVRAVLEFLGRHQDVDGKVLHELTTSGYAHYDAADSTPLYLVLMGRYVRATGDREFAAREFPRFLKAIDYCYSTDTDGDHLIENTNVGHGWVEGGQLFPSHSEHYLASCWAAALQGSAEVAGLLNKHRLATKWQRESRVVRQVLRKDFWNPVTGFYNFSKQSDGSYREERTVLPAVGMYFGCADEDNAKLSLDEYASANFSSDWGVRIVGKNDQLFNPTGYHYGSIWPLFTGWTALAEFSHSRPVQGTMHLFSNILLFDQFSGGNTEEVLHGEQFQPAGVCPHQAWSQSMVIQPLFEGMLGIRADAVKRSLRLAPYFPPHWKKVQVKNIRVGDQRVDLDVHRTDKETVFGASLRSSATKSKSRRSLSLTLEPFLPLGTKILGITIGSKRLVSKMVVTDFHKLPTLETRLDKKIEVRIRHTEGLAVIPPVPHVRHGQTSSGIRIINESWRDKSYILTVEGKAGEDSMIDIFDQSRTAKSVEGARVMDHDGDHLILAVPFAGKPSQESYVRKEIVIHT